MNKILPVTLVTLMSATPAFAGNTLEDHENLRATLSEAGVVTLVNTEDCEPGTDGYYWSKGKTLVVCQDNSRPNGPLVAWTANDLDTFRHEAHHVVQDCMIGGVGDNASGLYFETIDELKEFLEGSSLTGEQIKRIVEVYREDGVSDKDILEELEAFAVARDVNASSISNAVKSFCF